MSAADKEVPGDEMSMKKKVLDRGAALLQMFKPINQIHQHLCALHFYNGDMHRQVVAHHYCTHLNEDFHQCVLYDSAEPTARLIGIEYIISEKLFKELPEEEKKYWHSHHYEVKSGMLIAPNVPEMTEHALMKDLVNTYGKTIHTWQIDRGDKLPIGPPQLMMSFTNDDQPINRDLLKKIEQEFKVNMEAKRKNREDIPLPKVLDANQWQRGNVFQFKEFKVE